MYIERIEFLSPRVPKSNPPFRHQRRLLRMSTEQIGGGGRTKRTVPSRPCCDVLCVECEMNPQSKSCLCKMVMMIYIEGNRSWPSRSMESWWKMKKDDGNGSVVYFDASLQRVVPCWLWSRTEERHGRNRKNGRWTHDVLE
jgi:hypothetical protein